MEPLTALGLAGNVIQFIDFSSQLVSKGHKIYRSLDGTLDENIDAEIVATNLSQSNAKLQKSLSQGGISTATSADDKALVNLCQRCSDVASELLLRLDKLKVSGKHRKWKSARQALKTVIGKEELEQISNRLSLYRNEITLHIAVSLRERIDMMSLQHSKRFDELDSSAKSIMNAVALPKIQSIKSVTHTGFFEAASVGNRSRLRAILNRRDVDINIKDDKGRSALHLASASGHDLLVQTLIKNKANVDDEDNNGQTALHYAALGLHWATVRVLLMNGATHNAEDDDQRTPYYYTGLSKSEDGEICKWFFELGCDLNTRNIQDDTSLLVAAYSGFERLAWYLLDKGVEIEVTGHAGETPLIAAAANGNDTVVQALLTKGANTEALDRNGSTALIRAASRGHAQSVEALVKGGAHLEARNFHQDSSLIIAIDFNHTETAKILIEQGANPHGPHLHLASKRDRAEIIPMLLKAGADIEFSDEGGTNALLFSAYHNRSAAMLALLRDGANLEAKRNDGATALWLACESGHEPVAKILLDHGANVECIAQGYPPLVKATQRGHRQIIELLLQKVTNIESRNADGVTALHETAWGGNMKIAELLIDVGADIEKRDLTEGGCTPLIRASLNNHPGLADLFLERGADLEAKSTDLQHTALAAVAGHNREHMVLYLLRRGANVDTIDRMKRTPLMLAAHAGYKGIIEALLRYGAWKGAKDQAGLTALAWARSESRHDVIDLLT